MASFDGAYESLIQGVSQQVPTSRLPGQVTEQVNMVSDLVTGLRRRTGSKFRRTLSSAGVDPKSVKAWRTEVGGVSAECFLNANTGELIMLEQDGSKYGEEVVHRFQADYLKASDINSIRSTGVGDSMFILNTERVPFTVKDTSPATFKTGGFADVLGSALNMKFSLTVKVVGGGTFTGEYTTPDGTKPEHAGQVSTQVIAEELLKSIKSKSGFDKELSAVISGATLFFKSASGKALEVSTGNAKVYINTSRLGVLPNVSSLPVALPSLADGVVFEVGSPSTSPTYFKYKYTDSRWEEVSIPGSPSGIKNMPVEVYWDGEGWVLNTDTFEGRLAGDDESNPDPEFVDWGITGIASYQGRLVLMSGSWVLLSATNKPRVFYRTSVEELLDTDPIEIGSS